MTERKKLRFSKKDKATGNIKNVGYAEIVDSEESADLYFYGDIVSTKWDKWSYDDTCPKDIAEFLGSIEKSKDINMHINSGGGSVFAGLAIYNQLKAHDGHIKAYVDGIAASIASVIMLAGDEIVLGTGAQVMIHKPLTYAIGNADDLRNAISELDRCEESILDIYEENACEGVDRDDLREYISAETWFTADEFAEVFKATTQEKPVIAAYASDYYDLYSKGPKQVQAPNVPADNQSSEEQLVNAVIDRLKDIKNESEKQKLVEDLYMYGI